jgi:hypothetical protein
VKPFDEFDISRSGYKCITELIGKSNSKLILPESIFGGLFGDLNSFSGGTALCTGDFVWGLMDLTTLTRQ